MKKAFFILFSILATASIAQETKTVQDYYQHIFKINVNEYNGRTYTNKSIDSIEFDCVYTKYVNENKHFFNYYLTHFTDYKLYQGLDSISDSKEMQTEFVERLKTDSTLNANMNRLHAVITKQEGFVKDTFSFNETMDVAIKFFHIYRNRQGSLGGKLCIGMNGIKDCQQERHADLEAFCFSSIFKNAFGEVALYNELAIASKIVGKMDLGTDDDEIMFRSQGAMYMYFLQSDKLKKVIKEEYEANKDWLPFIISDIS